MGILKSVLRGTVKVAGFGVGVASGTATKVNEGIDVVKVSIDEGLKESLTVEEKAAVDKLFNESKDSGESLAMKGITGTVDMAASGLSGMSKMMDRLTRGINAKADKIKEAKEVDGGQKEVDTSVELSSSDEVKAVVEEVKEAVAKNKKEEEEIKESVKVSIEEVKDLVEVLEGEAIKSYHNGVSIDEINSQTVKIIEDREAEKKEQNAS